MSKIKRKKKKICKEKKKENEKKYNKQKAKHNRIKIKSKKLTNIFNPYKQTMKTKTKTLEESRNLSRGIRCPLTALHEGEEWSAHKKLASFALLQSVFLVFI